MYRAYRDKLINCSGDTAYVPYVHNTWSKKWFLALLIDAKITPFFSPGTASRKYSNFMPDPDIPPLFRADNSDYRSSGWSRGHMAPAGDNKFNQVQWYHLNLFNLFILTGYQVLCNFMGKHQRKIKFYNLLRIRVKICGQVVL